MTSADQQISALLQESQTLTVDKDSARLCAIYAEAASLVDRSQKPKKWAAFRFMYGQAVDSTNPQAALAAYREAAACLSPGDDKAAWASCKACIGWALVALGKVAPPESEEVIECLEAGVEDAPYAADTLALYYSSRVIGDPLENWKKQVQYLRLALAQVSPQSDPLKWAKLKNALAVALPREPDGDFLKAMETRRAYHREALAVLDNLKQQSGSPAQDLWIKICIDRSDAYIGEPGTEAEDCARKAYQSCGPLVAQATRILATMSLARALLNEHGPTGHERCNEALKLCSEADPLIDAKTQPVDAATNEKFKALAHLELFKLGESNHLSGLLSAADLSYSLLDAVLYSDMRRTVMQIAADGLVFACDYVQAIPYLQRAVESGERALQQATSRAGRLEKIFDLHDSYARLGYCHFQAGEIGKGLEAIDAGKGRLWRPSKTFATFEEIKTLVPHGGALLFSAFAPREGTIAIVTAQGERICPLKNFGRERLTELLLGDIRNPDSPSWMSQYIFRNRNPDRWRDTIDAMGATLFDTFWTPVLETLKALGINEGAELVWFPQAGLGVLPLQAAWKSAENGRNWIGDNYAIRYAPSASCLLNRRAKADHESTLIVSDPLGDLANSALELEWVRNQSATILVGSEAVKATVLERLADVSRAHFSTHAVFDIGDPFKSSLLLANGEMLSLDDLLPLMQTAPLREVILSGCETAMSQVARRPDELLGFPAAFLEHGIDTVVATQWPVDDWAAAALVGRFYREWRKSPDTTAAQAMRQAQRWMRNVTVEELTALLQPMIDKPEPVGSLAAEIRISLRGKKPQDQPFAHPYYWAPFTVSGI